MLAQAACFYCAPGPGHPQPSQLQERSFKLLSAAASSRSVTDSEGLQKPGLPMSSLTTRRCLCPACSPISKP
ncbi:MAG: hypothetical protein HC929_16005 [Leptolyngbyaceae cyanobacterium SM2_5_2]|nr:hypothetical protein [Leptolyngbyaceae cyanobacterium SM2_5_2]